MPLDHIGYYVPSASLETEVAFLLKALAHLHVQEFKRPHPSVVGLGPPGDPYLWVAAAEAAPSSATTSEAAVEQQRGAGILPHVAIKAGSREEVDRFHNAALEAGGQDNGKPGERTDYHAGYYAAFVRSPAGVNLEVVFHATAAWE